MPDIAALATVKVRPQKIQWKGWAAWRLSDGVTEAIVVPSIGRVMRYGYVNGPNLLWNSPKTDWKPNEWKNWGGDKTWPAPEAYWPVLGGKSWPPDKAWDGSPHKTELIGENVLRLTSPVSKTNGCRIVHEYSYGADGQFIVSQIAEKVQGSPLFLSLWSVTQIEHPDAVFLPLNPQSPYKTNMYCFHGSPRVDTIGNMARLYPASTKDDYYKVGVDITATTPMVVAVAVKYGVAFQFRANHTSGTYPDGAIQSGFPIELYSGGDKNPYEEIEMLSPLRLYTLGQSWRHTVEWKLHRLSSNDVNSLELDQQVQKLLTAGAPAETEIK